MLDMVIQKKIAELPANIRHAVDVFDWSSEILNLIKKYHLQIDDVDIFRRETLLVIVGLTDAADFEKNLMLHMGINSELADNLVTDANEHIFRPLQKIAFTHHDDVIEPEVIPHEKISDVLGDHGIELVDEFEPEPRPQNELQELADSLFKTNKSTNNDVNDLSTESVNTETTDKKSELSEDPVEYNEPISLKDLHGVSGHRIDTSILAEKPNQKEELFDEYVFNNTHISKTEYFDISPSKEEQIVENGDFLKHIGAS